MLTLLHHTELLLDETCLDCTMDTNRKRSIHNQTKYRKLAVSISALAVVAAIIATFVLTGPPAYSGFDVIGKQPAIVQVYLPG